MTEKKPVADSAEQQAKPFSTVPSDEPAAANDIKHMKPSEYRGPGGSHDITPNDNLQASCIGC